MHRVIVVGFVLVLVTSACSGTAVETTQPPATLTTSLPATSQPSLPPTTEPEPEPQVLALARKQISVLPTTTTLTAGLEASLLGAFDDYAGGIVFAQSAEVDGLWHLRAGRQQPTLLFSNPPGSTFDFLDLVAPSGRPPTALVRSGDTLLLLPITGGAPDELPIEGLATAATGGEFATASLGGGMLMVAWEDPSSCLTVDLFTLAGDPLSVGLFESCSATTPVMSDEGDVIVTIEPGPSTNVVIRSTTDGLERERWQVADPHGRFHVSGGRVAYADGQGVSLLTYEGTWERLDSPARPEAVSIARSTVDVSDLASLGGSAALTGCSSSSHRPLPPQSGLTEPAAITRDAIGNAAIECDIARLGSLLDASVVEDPTAGWWEDENKGFPVLLELVNLLETPFAAVEGEDGSLVYIWPAVAEGVDEDAAWDALRTLYNEEDIDRWKSGADPYDRLVVRITESGRWIQVSTEF